MRAAIVLAAGSGSRMGGPKALLLLEGSPLALLHVARAREAGCSKVVLVVSPEVAARLPVDAARYTVVVSRAPDPTGSLLIGVTALDPRATEVLVTPVDAPPARVETIASLFAAIRAGAHAATPVFGARGGHPVACATIVLQELAKHPRPLRDALQALGRARVRVPVDDPLVTTDLDTADDFVAFAGVPPTFAK
jgi:CTP:molybdopterin cytidylyltransferase MocA